MRSLDYRVFITQDENNVTFHDIAQSGFDYWLNFFDLNRDYDNIYAALSETGDIMRQCISFAPGIRIMNQNPWETLVCFLLSANNRIPMIMKSVELICGMFGTDCSFPLPHALSAATEDDLKACKTGFRAQRVVDAAVSVHNGSIKFDESIKDLPTDILRTELCKLNGVGVKIADCCMLFSHGRREVFPVDVWIGRAVSNFYFGGKDIPLPQIQVFAKEKFGDYAGYANQLLFNYARLNNLCGGLK